jgi:Ferric reductase like transmembrane component
VIALAANSKAYWYLTRSTGVVSLLLLTLSVVLGIMQVTRWSSPRWPRFVTQGLHRNISLVVVVFLGIHITTAVLDSFAPIHWLDAIVPFQARYRPVWLGLGALAIDLVIALVVTSLVRLRLGYGVWRAVHWLAYACWPIALLHGLGTGSDTRQTWSLLLDGACVAAVLGATLWRIATSTSVESGRRIGAVGASFAVLVGIALWTVVGPLQTGWARRAGTPVSLLASKRAAATVATTPRVRHATTTTTAPVPAFALPFHASIAGTLTETGPDANGQAVVVIDARLRNGATGRVHIALQGEALGGGGLRMEQSRAYLGSIAVPSLYAGSVTALQGTDIVASLRNADGRHADLTLNINIGANGTITGSARAARQAEHG